MYHLLFWLGSGCVPIYKVLAFDTTSVLCETCATWQLYTMEQIQTLYSGQDN